LTHSDHECIPVRLDVTAIKQAIVLMESGVRQEQMEWIKHGINQLKAQIDRAVRLGNVKTDD
jgi:hypothetical protein